MMASVAPIARADCSMESRAARRSASGTRTGPLGTEAASGMEEGIRRKPLRRARYSRLAKSTRSTGVKGRRRRISSRSLAVKRTNGLWVSMPPLGKKSLVWWYTITTSGWSRAPSSAR